MRWTGVIVALCVLLSPVSAPAASRPGKPRPATVLRAIDGVATATTFSSGKRAARTARRAFARRQYCPAATALGAHHAQVMRRLKRASRSAARRLVRLAGRSAKARGLVLRSLAIGKACGGKPAVGVDPTVKPPAGALPAVGGSGARRVARLVDATGATMDFVDDEVLLTATQAEAEAFAKRWSGKILATADTTLLGAKTKQYLIRIRASNADASVLSEDLAALSKTTRGGAATVSSGAGLDLLAAAGREARRGMDVGVNIVGRGSAIAFGSAIEDPRGPTNPNFSMTGSVWNTDPFQWSHLSSTGAQSTGTAAAWQLLAQTGRANNKIGVAVLDMGFSPSTNGGDFGEPLTAISNVPFNDALENDNIIGCGSSACPWHGSNVANTAFAEIDNNKGVAGTAGPVPRRIVIFTLYDFFTSISALLEAKVAGARVVNMSYGVGVPYYLSWSVYPFEFATEAARAVGMLVLASAGNDNANVDGTDCFLGACWEEKWFTPCENDGVMCVGALAHDSTAKASYSNYGNEHVDLFAPGTVLVGWDPATPFDPPKGKFGVHSVNGTSFASPYLAGVAALVFAADPSLGPGGVESILKNTARSSPDTKVRRYVNSLEAVRRALPRLVEISQPLDGSTLQKGPPVTLSAFVYEDGQGAPSSITWSLGNGTVLGTGATLQTSAIPYGTHDIRVRVAVPGGTLSDQVRLTMANTPPGIRITRPGAGATFYQNEQVPLEADSEDLNQGRLGEGQVRWFLDSAATPFATGHDVTLDLTGVSVGSHKVTARATDDAGAASDATVEIAVAPASANPPPTVSITAPADQSQHFLCNGCSDGNGSYALVDFQADVSDPNGNPLTYTWTEKLVHSGATTVRSSVEDPGVLKVYWDGCSGQGHDFTLSVSDGQSTRSDTVRIYTPVVC